MTTQDLADARLRRLSELRGNESLDLSYTGLRSSHCCLISSMSRLRDLRLVGTEIRDSDLLYLGLPTLQSLCLDETAVADEGLRNITRCAQLECLSLNNTRVTGAGLCHLRPLKRLECLSLVETAVGDDGVVSLREMTALRLLSLAGTAMSQVALTELRNALPECAVVSSAG